MLVEAEYFQLLFSSNGPLGSDYHTIYSATTVVQTEIYNQTVQFRQVKLLFLTFILYCRK